MSVSFWTESTFVKTVCIYVCVGFVRVQAACVRTCVLASLQYMQRSRN